MDQVHVPIAVDGKTAQAPELAPAPIRGETVPLGSRVIMGTLAGALLASGFPPYNLPILVPFGVALLLKCIRGASVRESTYSGLACGAVYFGGTLFWLGNLFGAAAVSLIAIAAVFIAVFGGAFSWLTQRRLGIPVWLLAPVLWTAIEFYRSELFALDFGWMGLGYAVINSPWLAAIASWLGSYGLTFGIVLLGTVILQSKARVPIIAAWAVTIYLPAETPVPHRPLSVRLVQAFSDDEEELFRRSQPSPDRVDFIIWPEYSLNSDPLRNPKLWAKLEAIARRNRCHFLFGAKDQIDRADEATFRNTAFLLAPDGSVAGTHVKNHTVHFVRDGVRGTGAAPITTSLGNVGVAICFDMDYPDVARRLAAGGAEVFLVPNMDPGEWGPVQREQHRLMFQMRAAECGKWLARADVAGGTSVCAPNGREVARVHTMDPETLAATVGRNKTKTAYVQWGWLLPRFSLIAAIAACLFGAMHRPRLREPARRKRGEQKVSGRRVLAVSVTPDGPEGQTGLRGPRARDLLWPS